MPGLKRAHDEKDDALHEENELPRARKRRVEYGKADTHRATIYNDLADDVQAVRLQAAGALLKTLSARSADRVQRIKDCLGRLVRGLCSGRKAARLGFSVALAEVLRLAFGIAASERTADFKLDTVTAKVVALTQADGKARGQEKREHLLGRRFAFHAILQSNMALDRATTDAEWRGFVDAVLELAAEKPWVRAECGAMLFEYFEGVDVSAVTQGRAQTLMAALHEKALTRTPEGVALWLAISARFPTIELPKGVWHANNPLSPEEAVRLKKVLHGNVVDGEGGSANGSSTGLRQSQPSFAWTVILSRLHTKDARTFEHFWTDAVEHGLFAAGSSNERRSLGLQIVSLAVATAPVAQLKHVLSNNVVHCLITQRAENGRYLFEAAKVTLNHIVARAHADPEAQAAIKILDVLLDAAINFDQLTKTKTIDSIVGQAKPSALKEMVSGLQTRLLRPNAKDASGTELCRRTLATMFHDLLKSHQDPASLFKEKSKSKEPKLASWAQTLLEGFVEVGYCALDEAQAQPPISDAQRTWSRSRLMSCLTLLLHLPMDQAVVPINKIIDLLRASDAAVSRSFKKDTRATLAMADRLRREAQDSAQTEDLSTRAAMQAYQLLFALSALQVYNGERESPDMLRDLCASFRDRGAAGGSGGGDATTMLVEILLSFLSKPSALFRRLAEQVFAAFAPELTADSMQSLLDILQQKEGLSGQQELFDDHGDEQDGDEDEDDEDDDDDDDGEAIDVEDDSDVEIANGEVVRGPEEDEDDEEEEEESSEEDADEGSDSASGAEQDPDDEDEETAFDRKLADALGTQGMDGDADSDGSDMDDDQMMALDGHLTTIFQERSKQSHKKQEHKDAKATVLHFKARVLDLLAIYVKAQPAAPLALALLLPLVRLVRSSASKPVAEKAFAVLKHYFDACAKHKLLPRPADPEAVFALLASLHADLPLGAAAKLHASAASRASLFVAKVLVAADPAAYARIAAMYAALQARWYLDPASMIQGSVFTEWTSWSLTTRKARAAALQLQQQQ
nr:dna polymerase v [Quercus suber]